MTATVFAVALARLDLPPRVPLPEGPFTMPGQPVESVRRSDAAAARACREDWRLSRGARLLRERIRLDLKAGDDGIRWMGQSRLSAMMDCSARHVRRFLSELVATRWTMVVPPAKEQRPDGTWKTTSTNGYVLTDPESDGEPPPRRGDRLCEARRIRGRRLTRKENRRSRRKDKGGLPSFVSQDQVAGQSAPPAPEIEKELPSRAGDVAGHVAACREAMRAARPPGLRGVLRV